MSSYAEQASKAHQAYRVAIQKARSFADPDLSTEALQKKRTAMHDAAEDAYTRERSAIQAEAERSHAIRRDAAGEARPKVTDHAQIDSSWKMVERLLDSGRTLRQIAAKANAATLLAIREHGPSYLESKTPVPGIGQEPTRVPDVARLVDDRLIELGGDAAKYINGEREARADLDRALVYTKAGAGDTDLALAIKAKLTGVQADDGDDE